jgi:hypothetical protein
MCAFLRFLVVTLNNIQAIVMVRVRSRQEINHLHGDWTNAMAVRTQLLVDQCQISWQWTHLGEMTDRSSSVSSATLGRETGHVLVADAVGTN